MSLELSTGELDGHTVVAVGGEIDLSNADTLRAELVAVLDERGPDIILDLADLGFISSQGLTALVAAQQHARRLGGTVRLAALRRPVTKLLRITAIGNLFEVYPTVEAACAGAPPASPPS